MKRSSKEIEENQLCRDEAQDGRHTSVGYNPLISMLRKRSTRDFGTYEYRLVIDIH